MTAWEDVVARARGLSARLLDGEERRRLAGSRDLTELATALDEAGFLVGPVVAGRVSPAHLDKAVRRRAADLLTLLARRCGERSGLLPVIFEDEDRRSLRALLRGAVQGASMEDRLGGLVPTPALPERVLEELARAESPAEIAGLLVLWRNAYGPPLMAEARRPHPDPFRLESILRITFFSRAGKAASDNALKRYLAERVDLENARTLLVLTSQPHEGGAEEWFLPGGSIVGARAFKRIAGQAADAAEAVATLGEVFAATPWGPDFAQRGVDPVSLDEALFATHLRALRRRAREEPLGPVPVLLFALQLRGEVLDLRRVIWGVALGLPGSVLALELMEV